jgi:nucleotide-binding universal stress UspA family protein
MTEDVTPDVLGHAPLGCAGRPRVPQVVEDQVVDPGREAGAHEALLDVVDSRARADAAKDVLSGRLFLAEYLQDSPDPLLRQASALAQEYQAELSLLHVLPPPPFQEPEVRWVGAGADCQEAMLLLQEAVPAEAHAWCHVHHAVQYGSPYQEILAYADGQEVDLVAMGAHGFGSGSQVFFGSNVDRVLRQARCPVLIAQPLCPADGQVAFA